MSTLKNEKRTLVIVILSIVFLLKIANLLLSGMIDFSLGKALIEVFCIVVFVCSVFLAIHFGKIFSFVVNLTALGIFAFMFFAGFIDPPSDLNMTKYLSVGWFYGALFVGNGFAIFL